MKVGFYQFNPLFGRKHVNLEKVTEATREAQMDLLVLPELFATGYQFTSKAEALNLSEPVPEGETTQAMVRLSREQNIHIVAGLAEQDGERLYNSAVITGPNGFIGVYRKTHLFFEEKLWFEPGDSGFRVFDTSVGRIGIMICFDWVFPESMRTLTLMGAEIICHPANLVLPWCPSAMPIRSLENRVFAVTANRIGSECRTADQCLTFIGTSQITAPDGSILARAPEQEEALITVDVDLAMAANKRLNPYNHLLEDRRPEFYKC
ncbi:MAG TPA: acyltransferase [Deltaproteobacteria bacterium]|nr:acyltransferase [Deltaproteobacteria bacterium]